MSEKCLNILGIRGIPAAHGGFETFAAHFAPFMRDNGWKVTVYCQEERSNNGSMRWEDEWEGIRRIHFATHSSGVLATIEFDFRSVIDVLRKPGIDLVLGYNTAVFTVIQRLAGRKLIMNMDGIEWKRAKWGHVAKTWFWMNEWIGGRVCHVPIADHPEIAAHLAIRGIKNAVVIPYGSDTISSADATILHKFGVSAGDYFVSIARIEPENSILEMVQAFVIANTGRKLMVLGKIDPNNYLYHSAIRAAANDQVIFPGAIYERNILTSLRYHCLAYIHGHQVGGTNPSLVEALGAGNAVIAHDNRFNRWTAGSGALYFSDATSCATAMKLISTDTTVRERLRENSMKRHQENFIFDDVHDRYKNIMDMASIVG